MIEQTLIKQAAEIAAAGHMGWGNTMQDAAVELAALRKDAERYRWLRDEASGGDWEHIGQSTDPTSTDAAIDKCMAAYKAVGAA
jgi:hypothetical protein